MIESSINTIIEKVEKFMAHAIGMIDKSVCGLLDEDLSLLESIVKKEEARANRYDDDIEKQCIVAIARFSPKAFNLRRLLMIIKMNKDIERMADHCVNISYNAKDIIESSLFVKNHCKKLSKMADEVKKMMSDSIRSFSEENLILAGEVRSHDKIVNEYQKELREFFINQMRADNDFIEVSLNYINIVNNLERIADLSTNIAEDVVFIMEGELVKH